MIWVGLGRRGVEFRCAGDKDRSCGDDGRRNELAVDSASSPNSGPLLERLRKDKASSEPMRGKVSEY
jgi:hypothetical protein